MFPFFRFRKGGINGKVIKVDHKGDQSMEYILCKECPNWLEKNYREGWDTAKVSEIMTSIEETVLQCLFSTEMKGTERH